MGMMGEAGDEGGWEGERRKITKERREEFYHVYSPRNHKIQATPLSPIKQCGKTANASSGNIDLCLYTYVRIYIHTLTYIQ